IYKMDYARMLIDHVENGARCTIACLPVPLEEASAFGVLKVDDKNRVVEVLEKPDNPPSMPGDASRALASLGIYAFDAEYLFDLLEHD
ncbi:sugar phosphate nucleotidyltransferase, partial [Erwinia amylovora]|uniref:sugar phosphate nucleotidyltransferase n=1 Tax=Erwinia amylovora TaxID=552 RepID=UPI00200B4066